MNYRSFLWQVLQRTRMRTILLHLGQRLVLRSIFNLVRGRMGIVQSSVSARPLHGSARDNLQKDNGAGV